MDLHPILVLCLLTVSSAELDCETEVGGKGKCVYIESCDPLFSLVKRNQGKPEFYKELHKFNCGYGIKDIKYCCPLVDCVTANGEAGVCTELENCPSIFSGDMQLIKKNQCTHKGFSFQKKVCCKSEEDNENKINEKSLFLSLPPMTPDNKNKNECAPTVFPPALDSKCCGIDAAHKNKIFGGTPTGIDQYPWLVMIEYPEPNKHCGGSLISAKYVLTAAHCMVGSKKKRPVSVRVGEYNTTNPGKDCTLADVDTLDCTYGAYSVLIESSIIHEGYTEYTKKTRVNKPHDIALVRLAVTVQYTDFVRPICLPTSDFTISPLDSLKFYVSGWGIYDDNRRSSAVKRHTILPYVTREKCNEMYNIAKLVIADTQICTGTELQKDICDGDSGGPLMLLKNITVEAVGINSFGSKRCAIRNSPSVYTKVYDYIDWINNKITEKEKKKPHDRSSHPMIRPHVTPTWP